MNTNTNFFTKKLQNKSIDTLINTEEVIKIIFFRTIAINGGHSLINKNTISILLKEIYDQTDIEINHFIDDELEICYLYKMSKNSINIYDFYSQFIHFLNEQDII